MTLPPPIALPLRFLCTSPLSYRDCLRRTAIAPPPVLLSLSLTHTPPKMNRLASPILLKGVVTKGFGRGSKLLGIPTANLPVDALGAQLDGVGTGIFLGWAQVDDSPVYKTVISVGWCVPWERRGGVGSSSWV